MPPDLPFADLMHRLQEGDAETACLIFDGYVHGACLPGGRAACHPSSPRIVDPEDVVQSVFRSFFTRHQEGRFLLENWSGLWNLLAVLTVSKCGQRVDHFLAARRDVRRELHRGRSRDSSGPLGIAVAPTPSPLEAVLLAETLATVLHDLGPAQRRIVQLRLEGYTIEDISNQVRCTERTVYRLLEKVRASLEPSPKGGDAP